uniref:Uncharacterized protein n=1 Tax=Rhizophora mucronata TaxID=61149 RepID=A0A2P2JPQ6_RHIMU
MVPISSSATARETKEKKWEFDCLLKKPSIEILLILNQPNTKTNFVRTTLFKDLYMPLLKKKGKKIRIFTCLELSPIYRNEDSQVLHQ